MHRSGFDNLSRRYALATCHPPLNVIKLRKSVTIQSIFNTSISKWKEQMDSNTIEFYTGLISCVKHLIESDDFKEQHRTSEKAFSRNRTLTLPIVTVFLLNMVKRSLQDELDEFFKLIQNKKIADRVVTKSAFTQARSKLQYESFIELYNDPQKLDHRLRYNR